MTLTLSLFAAKWLPPQVLSSPSYKEILGVVLMGTLATSHWLNHSLVGISQKIGKSASQEAPQCVSTVMVLFSIFQILCEIFTPL